MLLYYTGFEKGTIPTGSNPIFCMPCSNPGRIIITKTDFTTDFINM